MISTAKPVNKAKLARVCAPRAGAVRRASAIQVQAYKVTFVTPEGTSEVECPAGKYVLDAAEEAGIELPYSCRAGACSSCAGILEAGSVDQSAQTFLNEARLAAKYVLTCYASPESDCTIVTHKESELYEGAAPPVASS